MIATLEQLVDKLDILNTNTRELLYKLYLWNTEDSVETIPVTLRVPNAPYVQTFEIPTKQNAIKYISSSGNASKLSVSTKSWGKYSENEELHSAIYLEKGVDADVHFIHYDGYDVENAVNVILKDGVESDSFEFIVTLSTATGASDNGLVNFHDVDGVLLGSLHNLPTSTIPLDAGVESENVPVTYKVSFKYAIMKWCIFDYYAMPGYRYDGSTGFTYTPSFRDPTSL